MSKKVKLIRLKEAAEMLGVHPETLRRWDNQGKLHANRIGSRPGPSGKRVGDRRYKKEVIVKIIHEK